MSLFLFNSIIFFLIFLIICNWFQLHSFWSIIFGPKYETSSVNDKWIKSIVKEKTGLSLLNITIFHDQKMYGLMAGLPFWPKMILSEGLYKSFNKDELEWIVLHEAGHSVLWHNLEALLIQISILALGIYTTIKLNLPTLLVFLYSMLLSFICIQILRWTVEYAADKYSIDRVENPSGVITAQKKLRNAPVKNPFSSEKNILRFLLYWNIYPSKRVLMAKQKMEISNNLCHS